MTRNTFNNVAMAIRISARKTTHDERKVFNLLWNSNRTGVWSCLQIYGKRRKCKSERLQIIHQFDTEQQALDWLASCFADEMEEVCG